MKTYLDREYRHRYPMALVASAGLFAMGGVLIWSLTDMFMRGEFEDGGVAVMLLVVVLVLFLLLVGYAGGGLAYGWITDRKDYLVITDEGISHFGKFTGWEDIKRLSCEPKKKGEWMLFFQKNGIGADRYLPVAQPLTKDEIESLFEVLEKDLGPKYHGLRIGE